MYGFNTFDLPHDHDLQKLKRLRVDYFGTHLYECHGIECTDTDLTMTMWMGCATNGVDSTIQMRLLPRYLNESH